MDNNLFWNFLKGSNEWGSIQGFVSVSQGKLTWVTVRHEILQNHFFF